MNSKDVRLCVCMCVCGSRATEVISHLDRVHQQKKEGVKPSSLYLQLILEQSRYSSQQKMEQELLKHMPSVSDL